MKYGAWDIGGKIVKKDDRYVVKDNTELNNLIVSSTDLFPMKATSGHKHKGQEEVYIFIEGSGIMQLDDEKFNVHTGDTILIKDGVFHRVEALEDGCRFICVFDGKRYDS